MKLVIVESPTKAKTIERYLGKDYKVLASFGHVRDLAMSGYNDLGVDIDNDFTPKYEIVPKSERVIKQLSAKAKDAEEVLLATDPDREGEAISWHLAELLDLDIDDTKRLEFHEITKKAILEAIENPRTIDMNLVHSQEARRITDRIIGFKLSALVQKKLNARSAGRVQSVALKLIVDREREIESFQKEVSYKIEAVFKIGKKEYTSILVNEKGKEVEFENKEEAMKVLSILSNQMKVLSCDAEEKQNYSLYPLTTSSLQQEAFSHYKYRASKTMKIAQSLYEGVDLDSGRVGLITYMRTDSIRLSPKFIYAAKEYIKDTYGEEYVGYAKTQKENDNVQDAHEAIRPTDVNITPSSIKDKISKDEYNLYKLIWIRAVVSIMTAEKYSLKTIIFDNKGYTFKATGKSSIFEGYKKLYKELSNSKYEDIEDLEVNSIIPVKENKLKEEETKPPYRYSEASLIKKMEEEGIGRPSTYASTIDSLHKSLYIKEENKYLKPTDIALLVNDRLQDYFKDFINVKYTAKMEKELDHIADGSLNKLVYLHHTYDDFKEPFESATIIMPKQAVMLDETCPECGGQLRVSRSKFGEFISCSNYPTCSFKKAKEDELTGKEKECPICHEGKLVVRKGKYSNFLGCNRYPKCTYMEPLKKHFFKKKK
ncbi:MAG: type I DNA topoisomerase [Erysipelotrichaceae bacterium]|nr:type I DNA topoisomerase [Erysipelotrichaceae bacterium]